MASQLLVTRGEAPREGGQVRMINITAHDYRRK
jgi:hypothetical protein